MRSRAETKALREALKTDKAAGLTSRELCQKYNLSPQMLSHYIGERRKKSEAVTV